MKVFIATKNEKKLKELKRILIPMGFEVLSQNDYKEEFFEAEETGTTFEENAMIKAKCGLDFTGLISIADDSGLCVDELDGAPGIYSARFSGEHGNDSSNNDKLLRLLNDVPKNRRTARFVSAIACIFPDGESFTVRGECEGYISEKIEGEGGFGYDPLFISELGCFALIPPEQKDSISHRGKSLKKMKTELEKILNKRGKQC